MTEDEAKTKWCFAAVASHTDPRAGFHAPDENWPSDQPKTFACIGSACMAWRAKELVEIRHKRTGQVMPPDAWRARGDYDEVTVSDGGYCGLAGAPR